MFTSSFGLRFSRPIELIFALFSILIIVAIIFPVFAQARERTYVRSCAGNAKCQIQSLLMYAEDYDNRLPRAAEWMDDALLYRQNKTIYQCPDLPYELTEHQDKNNPTVFGYAFNNEFSAQLLSAIHSPDKALLTYDSSDLSWNANAYKRTGMARPPRHDKANVCGFLDGHVKAIKLLPDTPPGSEE